MQFRQFQDFEIDRLQLITDLISKDGTFKLAYHSASVEGRARLCVVRYAESMGQRPQDAPKDPLDESTKAHDAILETLW